MNNQTWASKAILLKMWRYWCSCRTLLLTATKWCSKHNLCVPTRWQTVCSKEGAWSSSTWCLCRGYQWTWGNCRLCRGHRTLLRSQCTRCATCRRCNCMYQTVTSSSSSTRSWRQQMLHVSMVFMHILRESLIKQAKHEIIKNYSTIQIA